MCINVLVTISQNEPLCCEGCSLLIISSSLLAMLTGGQRSPWCEVVSLLKFAFISSSIGSIGTKLHMWSVKVTVLCTANTQTHFLLSHISFSICCHIHHLHPMSQQSHLILFHSCPLCAAAEWRGFHRKSHNCCHSDSMLGILGDRGGVRECPCCLCLD